MIYKSKFYSQSFQHKVFYSRVISGAGIFIASFAMVGIFNYERTEVTSRRLIPKVINGLSHIDTTTFFITLFVAILLTLIGAILINSKYNDRFIIVGFEFNDELQQVKIRIRNVGGYVMSDKVVKYSNIGIIKEKLSDGMTSPMYDCLTFKSGIKTIGHYFLKHDMWNLVNEFDLQKQIEKIKTKSP